MYLYPENLTARPMLWLWTLRDVAFIGIGLLLSVLALTQVGSIAPLVVTALLAFLCIRHGGVSMLDFLHYAAAFFFLASNTMNGGSRHEKEKVHQAAGGHREHNGQQRTDGRR